MAKRIKKTEKKRKQAPKKNSAAGRKARIPKRAARSRAPERLAPRVRSEKRGVGEHLELMPISRRRASDAAGQSGDLQGLSGVEGANAESVEELLEEGNAYEAEVVSGVENARLPDKGPVRTREVKQDDVPEEYIDQDPFDRG
jgi:hypothetical protein